MQYTFSGPGQQGAETGRAFASYLLLSTGTDWQCLPAGSAHAQDACTQAVCIASLEALTGPAAHHGLRCLALQYGLHYHSVIVLKVAGLETMRFNVQDCEETRDLARKAVEMKWRWRGAFWIADCLFGRSRAPKMRSSLLSSLALASIRNILQL